MGDHSSLSGCSGRIGRIGVLAQKKALYLVKEQGKHQPNSCPPCEGPPAFDFRSTSVKPFRARARGLRPKIGSHTRAKPPTEAKRFCLQCLRHTEPRRSLLTHVGGPELEGCRARDGVAGGETGYFVRGRRLYFRHVFEVHVMVILPLSSLLEYVVNCCN